MEAATSVQRTSESSNVRAGGMRGGELARHLQGMRLIFWAQLLSAAFMNIWGIGLPFIGAGLFGLSMQTVNGMFRWSQIIPALAAVIASRGVFQLIHAPGLSASRFLLKLGVILEVLFRFRIAARAYGIEFDYPTPFWISRHLLMAVVVCGVFFACAATLVPFPKRSFNIC